MNNYGIDSLVQDKVDAYRGQPQALMQSYQNNQQLIDLLALQKLKAEKEAAARQLQLEMARKMGGEQPTVAEQREREVLDLTKQEVARNSTGAMQTLANQQQEALQGIASQAAPNMARMAEGGIVSFAEGGTLGEDLTEEEIQELIVGWRRDGTPILKDDLAMASRKDPKSAAAVDPNEFSAPNMAGLRAIASGIPSPKEMMEGLFRKLGGMDAPRDRSVPLPPISDAENEANVAAMTEQLPARAGAETTAQEGIAAALPAAPARAEYTAPTFEEYYRQASDVQSAERPGKITEGKDLYADDPALMAERTKRRAALETKYNELSDPKRNKMDQMIAFLTGGANRSGIGSVLSGAATGASQMRGQQEAAQANQLKELLGMAEADVARSDDKQAKIADYVSTAMNDVTSTVNSALQSAATMGSAAMSANERAADREQMRALEQARMQAQRAIEEMKLTGDTTKLSEVVSFLDHLQERLASIRMMPGVSEEEIEAAAVELEQAMDVVTRLGMGKLGAGAGMRFNPEDSEIVQVTP